MRTSLKKSAGIAVLALSMVTIGSVASAAGPEPVINGCVGKVTGLLRVIDQTKHQTCTRLETPISWAQRGLPGPAGAPGPAGPTGATGPAGPAGGSALWARVQTRDGENHSYVATLVNQSHAMSVDFNQQTNHYLLRFDRAVDQCAAQVTVVSAHNETASLNYFNTPPDTIDVSLWIDDWNAAVPGDFVLTVNC